VEDEFDAAGGSASVDIVVSPTGSSALIATRPKPEVKLLGRSHLFHFTPNDEMLLKDHIATHWMEFAELRDTDGSATADV